MKKIILCSLIFSFGIMLNVNNYAQTKEKTKKDKITTTDNQTVEKLNTICFVSHEKIDDDAVIVKYNGKTYKVCCKKCAVKFNNNPVKYLKRMKKGKEIGRVIKGKMEEKK